MKTELNVFFKMQQKDDKKEVLKFEIKGNDGENAANQLYQLAGSIIVFEIEGCAAGETTAEFMNIQRDSKKTVMKFAIKGDSEEKAQELYKFAGRNVKMTVQPSQMSIEEFYEEDHEGLEYKVNGDGTVDVDSDQLSLDDVAAAKEEDDLPDEVPEKVADLEQERKRRGRQKKNVQEDALQAAAENETWPTSDDDLPF
ncbi:hypothetical protein [Brevibacillus massiliensis]|uniref:hypothetical protein n=1 Tax=Brevibacillus massiliensis TaxID=1118054 RepID=UPI0002F6CC89|nr:hypothetical protein [Brevibacillus massiliensis]